MDGRLGRSAVWTLAGLSLAEVFALFSYAVQGYGTFAALRPVHLALSG